MHHPSAHAESQPRFAIAAMKRSNAASVISTVAPYRSPVIPPTSLDAYAPNARPIATPNATTNRPSAPNSTMAAASVVTAPMTSGPGQAASWNDAPRPSGRAYGNAAIAESIARRAAHGA